LVLLGGTYASVFLATNFFSTVVTMRRRVSKVEMGGWKLRHVDTTIRGEAYHDQGREGEIGAEDMERLRGKSRGLHGTQALMPNDPPY
jgi:hypothetical protein